MVGNGVRIDAILADEVGLVDDKLTIVGAGWNRLILADSESEMLVRIGLALLLRLTIGALDQDHELSIRLEGPDGEVVGLQLTDDSPFAERIVATVRVDRPHGTPLLDEETFPVAFNATCRLPGAGRYRFVIGLDGIDAKITSFQAVPAIPSA